MATSNPFKQRTKCKPLDLRSRGKTVLQRMSNYISVQYAVPHQCIFRIFFQKLHIGTLDGWNDLRNDPEGSGIDFIFSSIS